MAKFMWIISVSFAVKANHTISYARNTKPHFGWNTEVPLCIKCFPILVDCILTRGRHSHIPLVMALATVKMKSSVKRCLRQRSTGQEALSNQVVKQSNGRFNDLCTVVLAVVKG